MMGQLVEVAGLLLRDVFADLDGVMDGLGSIRGLAGLGQGFSLAPSNSASALRKE